MDSGSAPWSLSSGLPKAGPGGGLSGMTAEGAEHDVRQAGWKGCVFAQCFAMSSRPVTQTPSCFWT